MTDSPTKIIRHKVTRLLARREQSLHELRKKLLESVDDKALIEEVLAQFSAKDIQSDLRYAEAVVRGAYRKGKGPSFIERSLAEHDIEYSLVATLIASEDFDWFELARAVKVKKYGEEAPEDWQAKQKQMRFLQYRGFYQDQINYAFE